MVKWKSPLFSDLRNKLGDSVVFSSWKGRPYARQLVEPSNPNTEAQQAYRNSMAEVTSEWQSRQSIDGFKTGWNELAVDKQILGFNLFTRYAQGTDVEATAGASSGEVDVTFDTNIPLDQAVAIVYNETADSWSEEAVLESESGTVTLSGLSSGDDVNVWLGTSAHQNYGDSPENGACAVWNHDTDTGDAPRQSVTVP